MNIFNLHDLVYRYYKRMFFLFVPNICNSNCSFCYIKPQKSKCAVLSDSVLRKANEFVSSAKNIGFNEFRITGGEPLVFENISELFSICKKKNVFYTLITNGMDIQNQFNLFENNSPKKITISYHSKVNHNTIFGVDYDTDLLDENIRELCKRKINLAISITILEDNKSEILSHILHLKSLGVKSVKLIYPNDKEIKMRLKNEFIKTVESINLIRGIDVRYSDLKSQTCNMVNRGFLSFPLDQNKVYDCCYSMSNEKFISNVNSLEDFKAAIWSFYKEAQMLNEFPCKRYVEFCPIALNV